MDKSKTPPSEPSWRRRALQREQYFVNITHQRSTSSDDGTATPSSASPAPLSSAQQSRPHFIPNVPPQGLAPQLKLDTHVGDLLATGKSSPNLTPSGGTSPASLWSRRALSLKPVNTRGNRPTDSDNTSLTISTFSVESGERASLNTHPSTTCDNTGNVTSAAMLSPASLFTANINAQSAGRRSSAPTTNATHSKKPKGQGGMLSAWNRRKNKNLPDDRNPNVGSLSANANSTKPSPADSSRSWATDAGTSPLDSMRSLQFPTSAVKASDAHSLKPRARSGKPEEAENIEELCDLLNEQRIRPGDAKEVADGPKSAFDWSSSDDDDDVPAPKEPKEPKVSKGAFSRFMKSNKVAAAAAGKHGAAAAEANVGMDSDEEAIRKLTVLFAPGGAGGSRANAFREHPELLDMVASRGEVPVGKAKIHHVIDTTQAQAAGFSRDAAVKRSSVLKLFDDPIWGGESVTGQDFREREFSTLKPGSNAYNRARARPSRLSTSRSMPSLMATPEKTVQQKATDDINISPGKHRQGRDDMDVPPVPSLPSKDSPLLVRSSTTEQEKASIAQGSNKNEAHAALVISPPYPRKPVDLVVSPPIYALPVAGSSVPMTPSKLRQTTGADDSFKPREGDPFMEDIFPPTKKASSKSFDSGRAASEAHSASLEMARINTGSSNSVRAPSSSAASFASSRFATPSLKSKRLEKPKEPTFADATMPRSSSGTVAEPRRFDLLPPALEQKRLSRMKAGKDVVRRGSQLGLFPMKPVGEITGQEFEAVGLAATIPEKDASAARKSKILGSFFKKVRDTSQQTKDQAEDVCQQLNDHAALRFLGDAKASHIDSPSAEARAHFEKALQLLTGAGEDVTVKEHKKPNANPPVGLGIISEQGSTLAQEPFIIPDSYRLTAGPGSDSAECAHSKAAMTDTGGFTKGPTTQDHDTESVSSACSVETVEEYHAPEGYPGIVTGQRSASMPNSLTPAPLRVQKRRPQAPALQTLKVDRSSKFVRLEKSPSFVPRRDSTFMRKIREASEAKEVELGSHPAMREVSQALDDLSQDINESMTRFHSQPQLARVDSGLDWGVNEIRDEGDAKRSTREQKSMDQRLSREIIISPSPSNSLEHHRSSAPSTKTNYSRLSVKVDMQKLRNEMDLQPLQLPVGDDTPRHPNHPFTWDHEKVMCRGIHNHRDPQPEFPEVPKGWKIPLPRVNSMYFDKRERPDDTDNLQKCSICGKLCCMYAGLMVAFKTTGQDIEAKAKRLKAEDRISQLRGAHPNGIEEYETFVVCGMCRRKVCPGCASRCMDELCSDVYCVECGQGVDRCPIHNTF
ncbi:uncharacterized protein LTR77_000230 [Saxophila tyrrhenica]|uniref:4Fe-4S ferredoxin-type domain-containing protein n=1 Tax=Saxophila tyrrhenica TaxID=1690608 RepID=A0AAV9PRV1_9PEZI|nr:hypothetical protein LTR77_000230 [Saxophila tyrrhenica]